MTEPAQPSYVACAGDAVRGRDHVLDIWRGSLGHPASHAAKYDWFHFACPYGPPLLYLLRHQATASWVGTCSAGVRRMLWRGETIRAGVLADFAVTAAHRTLGPAMLMQSALLEAAVGQFDLIYGFPNPKSLPVVRKLGYAVMCQLGRYSYVLRHEEYLRRILSRWLVPAAAWSLDRLDRLRPRWWRSRDLRLDVQWSDRVDPRMDELWSESAPGDSPIGIRDCVFLRWRFDQADLVRTRYLLLGEPDGRLRAWFACQAEGSSLHVRDFWSREAATGLSGAHLRALVRAARQAGYAAVSVEYAGPKPALDAWVKFGFRLRDQRPVVGRWLAADVPPANLHLTAADEDQ